MTFESRKSFKLAHLAPYIFLYKGSNKRLPFADSTTKYDHPRYLRFNLAPMANTSPISQFDTPTLIALFGTCRRINKIFLYVLYLPAGRQVLKILSILSRKGNSYAMNLGASPQFGIDEKILDTVRKAV
jgi:hypothetical protein